MPEKSLPALLIESWLCYHQGHPPEQGINSRLIPQCHQQELQALYCVFSGKRTRWVWGTKKIIPQPSGKKQKKTLPGFVLQGVTQGQPQSHPGGAQNVPVPAPKLPCCSRGWQMKVIWSQLAPKQLFFPFCPKAASSPVRISILFSVSFIPINFLFFFFFSRAEQDFRSLGFSLCLKRVIRMSRHWRVSQRNHQSDQEEKAEGYQI